MKTRICALMFLLLLTMIIAPVAATSESSGIEVAGTQSALTNSTLGSTVPIQPKPSIDLNECPYKTPDDFVNTTSTSSDLVELVSNKSGESGAMPEASGYTLELTPGEYFPDVSVARVIKNMWIDHPSSSQTLCDLTFIMSNPDEEHSRFFRVYLDGSPIYDEIHNTKKLAETIRITVPDGLHEFVFEVYHGFHGKGWALEMAELWTIIQHQNLFTSADLAENKLFPQEYWATLNEYVCNIHGYTPKLHLAVESSDPYSRFLYVKVNDQQIYTRVIYRSWEVTLDLSAYMPLTDIYKVTVQIRSGAYRQWNLVYLGVERSDAKHIPYTINMGVSMSWTPTTEYLDDFIQGLRNFVDMLWSATEEQLLVIQIDIYFDEVLNRNQPGTWPSHTNIYVDENYHGNPYAWGGTHKFVLPYQWSPPWSSYMAYHAITHEFAHAYFSVMNEFEVDQWGNPLDVECGPYWWSGFCVMDIVQAEWWPRPEFCVRTNHDPDKDTPQEATYHEACWETIKRLSYAEMYEPFETRSPFIYYVAGWYCTINHP